MCILVRKIRMPSAIYTGMMIHVLPECPETILKPSQSYHADLKKKIACYGIVDTSFGWTYYLRVYLRDIEGHCKANTFIIKARRGAILGR